ncbi:MAG: tetratricopeptide repeat protein [Cyanobacteria bacterium P01_F01_bin.143]
MKNLKSASVLFLVVGSLFFSGYSSVQAEIKDDSKSENLSQKTTISEVDPALRDEAIKKGEEASKKIALLKKDSSLSTTAKRILDKADEANQQGNNELYLETIREYYQILDDDSIKRQVESKILLARVLFSQFQLKEAQKVLEEAVVLDPKNIESKLELAENLRWNGDYRRMEKVSLEAIELIEDQGTVDEWLLSRGLNSLGLAYLFGGQYDLAVSPFEEALELNKKILGEENPDVSVSLHNLALLCKSQGKYSEAEPLYIQSLELDKKLLGEEHPNIASSLNNLASLYRAQGKYSEAEPLYIQSLELLKKRLGEEHPNIASSLSNLAMLYTDQGRYSEAEPLALQALELDKKLLGEEHPGVAISLNNLAILYYHQERYSEAKPLFEEALKIAEAKLGVDHPSIKNYRQHLQINLDAMNKQR